MRVRMDERLDERSRIARELHDTLLQSVQGLVLKIHVATQLLPAQEPVRGLLDAALTQAETTIADGRNRAQDLRTHEDGSQLVPLLKASGHAWAHDNGTEFTVAIDGAARLLSPGVGSEVLAICREAMSNAFQHAHAGHVGVDVAFGSKALTITVSDDGMGIPVDAAAHGRAGHFGLVGMRERAARLGGELTVAPGQEGGTVCILKLPAALVGLSGLSGFREVAPCARCQHTVFLFRESEMSKEADNKALVLAAFEAAFNQRDPAAAERYWSPTFIQHSAHIPPNRDGLFNLIAQLAPTAKYEHSLVMAEGDFVVLHGRYTGLPGPSWVVVDIVPIENVLLAKHWDVIQDEATSVSSQSGLPMLGTRFPDQPD